MASADPSQAMKARILGHMTSDHAESLALYLNHYCNIPTPLTPPPSTLKLDDITLDHIIISHSGGRNIVPITPPMDSLTEARERLITMHKDCLAALGLSDFKVDTFLLPNKPWQWFTHLVTALCFVTFSIYPAEAFLPEANTLASKIWSIGGLVPGLARTAYHVKDSVLALMIVIHVGEAAYFARARLRKFWVGTFTSVWWAWTAAVFNGGVAGITRFDEMVREMEEEKKKKKDGKH